MTDALVEGYEHLIEKLDLPDPGDRHVVAAAIISKSSVIVTHNLKHFPDRILKPLGIGAISPDEFVLDQIDLSPELVLQAVRRHKDSLKNPAVTWNEYLSTLDRQRLTNTVNAIKKELLPQTDWTLEDHS